MPALVFLAGGCTWSPPLPHSQASASAGSQTQFRPTHWLRGATGGELGVTVRWGG